MLRIDAQRVDALVSLTSELTVAKNAIGHIAMLAQESDNPLSAAITEEHGKLDRLLAGCKARCWNCASCRYAECSKGFRALSANVGMLGKPVRLIIEGEDTQADKAIVEMLFEPLLHVVRNAMDHGVESRAERAAAGKRAIATIFARASRGRTCHCRGRRRWPRNRRRTAFAALPSNAVWRPPRRSGHERRSRHRLDLHAGFFDRGRRHRPSGRGVGMDAVRAAVERLGGRVQLKTRTGAGSTVRFLLPFSVMMTRVMTVEAGGQLFGIPLDAVVETVRVPRQRSGRSVKPMLSCCAIRLFPLLDWPRPSG